MKKLLTVLLTVLIAFTTLTVNVTALENEGSTTENVEEIEEEKKEEIVEVASENVIEKEAEEIEEELLEESTKEVVEEPSEEVIEEIKQELSEEVVEEIKEEEHLEEIVEEIKEVELPEEVITYKKTYVPATEIQAGHRYVILSNTLNIMKQSEEDSPTSLALDPTGWALFSITVSVTDESEFEKIELTAVEHMDEKNNIRHQLYFSGDENSYLCYADDNADVKIGTENKVDFYTNKMGLLYSQNNDNTNPEDVNYPIKLLGNVCNEGDTWDYCIGETTKKSSYIYEEKKEIPSPFDEYIPGIYTKNLTQGDDEYCGPNEICDHNEGDNIEILVKSGFLSSSLIIGKAKVNGQLETLSNNYKYKANRTRWEEGDSEPYYVDKTVTWFDYTVGEESIDSITFKAVGLSGTVYDAFSIPGHYRVYIYDEKINCFEDYNPLVVNDITEEIELPVITNIPEGTEFSYWLIKSYDTEIGTIDADKTSFKLEELEDYDQYLDKTLSLYPIFEGVELPTFTTPLTYTGRPQTLFNSRYLKDLCTFSGDKLTQTNAKKYSSVLTLKDNCRWALPEELPETIIIDEHNPNKITINWEIEAKKIAVPTARDNLVYNTRRQKAFIDNNIDNLIRAGIVTATTSYESQRDYRGYEGTDAGSYVTKLKINGSNYVWDGDGVEGDTATISWNIAKREIKLEEVTVSSKTFIYNGNRQQPNVFIRTKDGISLRNGYDYKTKAYDDQGNDDIINAGKKYINITLSNNYRFESEESKVSNKVERTGLEIEYEIIKAQVNVTLDKNSFIYNGEIQKPRETVRVLTGGLRGRTLGNDAYTLTYATAVSGNEDLSIDAGDKTVTVSLNEIGNYSRNFYFLLDRDQVPAITLGYKIIPATLTASISEDSFVYDGKQHKPVPTVTITNGSKRGTTLSSKAYELTYLNVIPGIEDATNAGDKTVTISLYDNAAKNYDFIVSSKPVDAKTLGYKILPALVELKLDKETFIYNGDVQKPKETVTIITGGLRGTKLDKKAYTLTYANVVPGSEDKSIDAGDKTVTVSLKEKGNYTNNYDFIVSGKPVDAKTLGYKITPATLTATISKDSFVYDSKEHKPVPTVTITSGKLAGKELDSANFDIIYSKDVTDVGNKTVTVKLYDTAARNYDFIVSGKPVDAMTLGYTITPKPINLEWINAKSYVYDGEYHSPDLVITDADGNLFKFYPRDLITTIQLDIPEEDEAPKTIEELNKYANANAIKVLRQVNAGKYRALGFIVGKGVGNYTFKGGDSGVIFDGLAVGTDVTFDIKPRELSVVWGDKVKFKYDKKEHAPEILDVVAINDDNEDTTGIVERDIDIIKVDYDSVDGKKVKPGTYEAKAVVYSKHSYTHPAGNYKIVENETKAFKIYRKPNEDTTPVKTGVDR